MLIYPSGFNFLFSYSETTGAEDAESAEEPAYRISGSTLKGIILTMFFLSGATGLIYEIVWNRMLTLVFGSTVYATTTVLTAFMAGMALGSFYFGRLADLNKNPLRIYAYLEGGIGIFALLLPLILTFTDSAYIAIHQELSGSFYIMSLVRFLLCFMVLIIPTTLMGGTLPVISKAITYRMQRLGWNIGILYAINTFGAVLGCFLAGFVLIRTIGISRTIYLASAVNVIIALLILYAFGRQDSTVYKRKASIQESAETESIQYSKKVGHLGLWVLAVSGFCALAYEVLWMRILVLFLGSTTYAFTTMLSAFLCGLALGSILLSASIRFIDNSKSHLTVLGIMQAGIALFAILLIPLYGKLYSIGMGFTGKGWLTFVVSKFSMSFLVMLIPTLLMGATFPLVSRIYARSYKELGKSIGNVYSINTLGSIFGSLIAGFVLIPLIGIQRSIMVIAFLNLAAGASALIMDNIIPVTSSKKSANAVFRMLPLAISVVVIIIVVLVIDTGKPLTKYTAIFKGAGADNKLLSYEEDVDASVTVVEDSEEVRRIFVDTNQAAEDSRWDLPSHNIIGHLPILLHPNPENSLVIGFGMGVTSWAISCYGVQVDGVEISPGVVKANKFFTEINNNVLESPLVKLYIDDGRNFALTTDKKYDMISTGIIHPLVSANSAGFYTKDFYELCKKILTENGIMCQWVPLHRLPEEHYKMIIRTFKASFPHTTLWYKYTPDFVILIGTPQELKIDFQDFKNRIEGNNKVVADLERVNMADPIALLDSFMMDEKTIDEYIGEGELHTDDRPRMEFFGPQPSGTTYANLIGMVKFRTSVLPYLTNIAESLDEMNELKDKFQQYFEATEYAIDGQLFYVRGDFENSVRQYRMASALNPNDENAKWLANFVLEQMGMSETELVDRTKKGGDADAHIKLGIVYQNQNKLDEAAAELKKAIEINPDSLVAHSNLAGVYESQGKIPEAISEFKEIIRIQPTLAPAYTGLGLLYQEQGDYDKAMEAMKKAIELDPTSLVARINLGMIYHKKGMINEAIKEFEALVKSQPNSAMMRGMLGDLYREKGDFDKAEAQFNEALKLDPNMGLLYHSLAILNLQRGGDLDSALKNAQRAVKLNPAPRFVATLALAYYEKEMYEEAEEEILKAISAEPNNKNYLEILDRIRKAK